MEKLPSDRGPDSPDSIHARTQFVKTEKNPMPSAPNGYVAVIPPPIPMNSNACCTSESASGCPVSDSSTAECHETNDSGVHSGNELGSDTKSTSSSPGLSADSSVHELCDSDNHCPATSSKSLQCQVSLPTEQCVAETAVDSVSEAMSKLTTDSKCLNERDIDIDNGLEYVVYESELQMPDIMRLITKDLSEPYSIYTYRYFIHNWPKLCFLAMDGTKCVGAIVCKLDMHKKMMRRGYIAMLAVDQNYRRKGIGSHLVLKAIRAMITDDCDEVVLETEITNKAALRLYENLGFVRDKRLFRYYLNGVDALRLKLWLR